MTVQARALHDLLESKPAASKLFAALRIGELAEEGRTTVDDVATLDGVTRREAIDVLRRLEAIGAGEFKVGRKGHPSRVEWSVDPLELAAATAAAELDGEPAEPDESGEPAEVEAQVESQGSLSLVEGFGGESAEEGEAGGEAEPAPDPAEAEAPRPRKSRRGRGSARAQRRPISANAREAVASLLEHVHWLRPDLAVRVALPADLTAREAAVLADWLRNLSFER